MPHSAIIAGVLSTFREGTHGLEIESSRCNRIVPRLRQAIALELAYCGAAVCIDCVPQRDVARTGVADIQTHRGRSIAVGADIGGPAQAATFIAQAAARIRPLTILVDNAGVVMYGTLDDYDHAAYQRMRGINVEGLSHYPCGNRRHARSWL